MQLALALSQRRCRLRLACVSVVCPTSASLLQYVLCLLWRHAELPGKPSSVVLSHPGVCTTTACIAVTWSFPWVPHHNVYCSGGGTVSTGPNLCPLTMGRASQADGGSPITFYTIEWSRNHDFCTIDGSVDVPSDAYTYVIQYLTGGLQYYVRIYAVNAVGRSDAQTGAGLLGDQGQLVLTAA